MLGLETLDVAIGVIFVYLLLSLICSAVSEMIEAVLKRRATNLAEGVRVLLDDEDGTGWAEKLYQHPLVFSLFRDGYSPTGRNLPAYIPARNFALALMDIVSKATPENASGARGATAPSAGALEAADQFLALRGSVANLPEGKLKDALLTLVDAAGNDVSRARENIEDWFNSSMDRVSGWYKRRAQVILLFIGLGVTVFANADTIVIVNSLAQDHALRQSLVAAAQEYAKSNPPPAGGAAPAPSPDPASPIEACRKDADSPECRVQRNQQQLQQLGLPVGWDRADARKVPGDLGGWALKVLGWLLTTMAVSLGAPFWFDLLNKFMVIRSTVKPHEKSPEEASEDRQPSPAGARAGAADGLPSAGGGAAAAPAGLLAASPSDPFLPNEWATGDPQEGII